MNNKRVKKWYILFSLIIFGAFIYGVWSLVAPENKTKVAEDKQTTQVPKEENKDKEVVKETQKKEEKKDNKDTNTLPPVKVEKKEEPKKDTTQKVNRTSENVVTTEPVEFETIKREDGSLEEGEEILEQEGKEGEITIVSLITKENGKVVDEKEIDRYVSSEPVNQIIRIGTKPKLVRREVTEEKIMSIDYQIKAKDNPNLDVGITNIVRHGQYGEKTLTYRVIYENDREIDRKLISEKVTKEPVTEIVEVCTKRNNN